MQTVLIEPHYFPNIQFFSMILKYRHLVLDDLSYYQKQSYRNRCEIMGANKKLNLIVPVLRGRSKIVIGDVEIAYEEAWKKNHWTSIFSAYNKSPYFLYYKDAIADVFEKKYKHLFTFDKDVIETLLRLLEIDVKVSRLSEIELNSDYFDARDMIHPKRPAMPEKLMYKEQPYIQVFSDRFAFVPNLSILDLLFNMGRESYDVLTRSI